MSQTSQGNVRQRNGGHLGRSVKRFLHNARKSKAIYAQSPATFQNAADFLDAGHEQEMRELLDHFYEHNPQEICENPKVGLLLDAFARHGEAAYVTAIISDLSHRFPHIAASNASILSALGEVSRHGCAQQAASIFEDLAETSPAFVAANPSLGWAVSKMLEADGDAQTVVDVIEHMSRNNSHALARNFSIGRVVESIQPIGSTNTVRDITTRLNAANTLGR